MVSLGEKGVRLFVGESSIVQLQGFHVQKKLYPSRAVINPAINQSRFGAKKIVQSAQVVERNRRVSGVSALKQPILGRLDLLGRRDQTLTSDLKVDLLRLQGTHIEANRSAYLILQGHEVAPGLLVDYLAVSIVILLDLAVERAVERHADAVVAGRRPEIKDAVAARRGADIGIDGQIDPGPQEIGGPC